MNDIQEIKNFEDILDEELKKQLSSIPLSCEEIVELFLDQYENAILEISKRGASNSNIKQTAAFFKRCLEVALPYFIDKPKTDQSSVKYHGRNKLMNTLDFLNYYYIIRELLYYTYNSSQSIKWSFKNNRVKIRFRDKSIPWQFKVIDNNYYLKSNELFSDFNERLKVIELLSTSEEFTDSDEVKKAFKLIENEAEIKLSSYYNFFDDLGDVSIGAYTINQFTIVFKHILIKALYHRYYNFINSNSTPICIKLTELVSAISKDSGIPQETCKNILMDISYNLEIKKLNIQPMHCCLYYFEDSDNIWMSPNVVCTWECFVNILRISAIKYPDNFQRNISSKLSANFTKKLMDKFTEKGFRCIPNVKLNKFDNRLPDIDSLLISQEPSLGYVVFCIEVKNQIPAIWSKDHVKVLNTKEGIGKGVSQINLIREFISTEQGMNFIYEIIPKINFPIEFNGEHIMLIKSLIVSSFNTGMFFGESDVKIIDYHSLNRLLQKCDGDIAYIMRGLEFYKNPPDKLVSTIKSKFKCGKFKVDFEFAGGGDELFDFPDHQWNQDGYSEKLLQEYVEAGYSPFMYLKNKGRATDGGIG